MASSALSPPHEADADVEQQQRNHQPTREGPEDEEQGGQHQDYPVTVPRPPFSESQHFDPQGKATYEREGEGSGSLR